MIKTLPGRSFPLGVRIAPRGVNFSVYSRKSTAMQLLLFNSPEDAQPAEVIDLDPRTNRTYHFWHIFLPGIKPGQVYAYRAFGPNDPASGLRFDPEKSSWILTDAPWRFPASMIAARRFFPATTPPAR